MQLEPEQDDQLKELAESRGVYVNELVREAVGRYLGDPPPAPPPPPLEVAAKFLGELSQTARVELATTVLDSVAEILGDAALRRTKKAPARKAS